MKILITGDSHTGAIKRGLVHLQDTQRLPADCEFHVTPMGGGNILADPFFVDEGTQLRVSSPKHEDDDFVLPIPDADYDWYGICGPLHTVRMYRDRDWLNFSTRDMPPAPTPLTISAFRRAIRDDQRYLLEFLKALKRIGAKVFVVEPPRPFRHHRRVRLFGAEKLRAIDGFYRLVIREELARLGIPVVSVPASTLDEEGFTRDEFRSEREGDQHHGSIAFGALVLDEVARFAREHKPA